MYADYNDKKNQTLDHILGSLLHQFLTTAPQQILDEVAEQIQLIQRSRRNIGTEDISPLLKQRLKQFNRAFICIDAADELEPEVLQQLLKVLKDFVTNNTRIFLTGRGYIQSKIEEYLKIVPRYKATISANQQDIQKFVEQEIMHDRDSDAMDELLAQDIVDTIIMKSQGM